MLNPLELSRTPDDPMRDAEDLARDLAYGAGLGDWEATFYFDFRSGVQLRELKESPTIATFEQKWSPERHRAPDVSDWFLIFGYAEKIGNESYRLTPRAFELLQKPTRTPNIFISYRHAESSAFALLIEARLRLVGVQTSFVDKHIKGGDAWHGTLREKVQSSDYLVCLIGQTSLVPGSFVRNELEWARDVPTCKLIHVWHNGSRMTTHLPADLAFLAERHGYEVKEESAAEYENAVNFILNSMGYNTY